MRTLLTTITLLVFSIAASNNTSTASRARFAAPETLSVQPAIAAGPILSVPPAIAGALLGTVGLLTAPPQRGPRFSSAYTALTKCGSGMTKKEEKEAEEHGSDILSSRHSHWVRGLNWEDLIRKRRAQVLASGQT